MKIEEIYDGVAEDYEDLIKSPVVNAKLLGQLEKIFITYGIKKGSILDLGCGPGNLKNVLGDDFNYTGVDLSNLMLSKAKDKGYETINGNISKVLETIPDRSFDYVVSISALHFVKDIDHVISEINRISRKGWIISLADITDNYKNKFPVDEPMFNHVNLNILNTTVDIYLDAWTSPTTGERIKERVVFRIIEG